MTKLRALKLTLAAKKGWLQSKTEKKASDDVATQYACDNNVATVRVKLFSNDITESICTLYSRLRNAVSDATISSLNADSSFVVPIARYDEVKKLIDDAATKLSSLLSDLQTSYDSYIDAERVRVGGLFDHRNYRSFDDIKRGTFCTFTIDAFSDSHALVGLYDDSDKQDALLEKHADEERKQLEHCEAVLIGRIDKEVRNTVSILRRYHVDGKRLDAEQRVDVLRSTVADCNDLNFVDSMKVADRVDNLKRVLRNVDALSLKTPAYGEKFCVDILAAIGVASAAPVVAAPVVAAPVMRRLRPSDFE